MTRLLERPLAGILASAVLLTGILGWLVADRLRLLANGREIVLAVRPVDPRDLFKGDYVTLGYDISVLDAALVAASPRPPSIGANGATIYVTLAEDETKAWKPVAASWSRPTATPTDRIVLKGRTFAADGRRVIYGIERYFVPEGTGGRLEDLARTSKLSVVVAVYTGGNAAIKALVVDGKRIYEEPLL